LSALSGGHHLHPLSPGATDEEKAALARRYQPDALLVEQAASASGFAAPHALVLTQAECERLFADAPCFALPGAREGSVYLTTSGSTGEPKSVILNERRIAWTAAQICASHQLTP